MITRRSFAEQVAARKLERQQTTRIVKDLAEECFRNFVDIGDLYVGLGIQLDKLDAGYEEVRVVDELGQTSCVQVPLSKERTSQIKIIVDSLHRSLNKLVADQRAIEVKGNGLLAGHETAQELEGALRQYGVDPTALRAKFALR